MNHTLWQLIQTLSQIRGISSKQAERSVRIAEVAHNFDQITQKIGEAMSHHVTTAHQTVEAIDNIHKLVQRITSGTEKATLLTNELFSLGGNLAFSMGEFMLSSRTSPPEIAENIPLIGFVRHRRKSKPPGYLPDKRSRDDGISQCPP